MNIGNKVQRAIEYRDKDRQTPIKFSEEVYEIISIDDESIDIWALISDYPNNNDFMDVRVKDLKLCEVQNDN